MLGSLLFPQHLTECLAYRRCSVNKDKGMNEVMNQESSNMRAGKDLENELTSKPQIVDEENGS